MTVGAQTLRLLLGPLRYEFVAHDAWAAQALSRLREHVECLGFDGPAQRVFHAGEFRLTARESAQINADVLPKRLADILPTPPRRGWRLTGDETGHMSWCHPRIRHAIWSHGTVAARADAPFQLPWQPILEDIVEQGGAIIHAGLALSPETCCLVTAPPGGGKTTALSRMPEPWRVLADDAALVWPVANRGFAASPLPTWSVLLGRGAPLRGIGQWQVGRCFGVARTVILKKSIRDRLVRLDDIRAAPHLYRAVSEHPRVVSNRVAFRSALFHTACRLSREHPAWELELTVDGRLWDLLPPLVEPK
jgi:hypothetical protein